jgi:hypothetical protein
LSGALFALFVAAGLGLLYAMARRDHRREADRRACLLDRLAALLPQASTTIRPDGYPALAGRLADGRAVTVELIPDTLVYRRLPELWLIATIEEETPAGGPSVGGLSRPTGAEFYALVPALPQLLEMPEGVETSLLLRCSSDFAGSAAERLGRAVIGVFADPTVKEVVSTPRFTRIVRQAAEGERGAHLVLRQSRFLIDQVPPELVTRAIAEADLLREARMPAAALPGATLSGAAHDLA